MSFPPELMGYRAWVAWKYEDNPTQTKKTKIPYSPVTGRKASTTNPDDWSCYAQAVAFVQTRPWMDGIGFVLSDADPYTVIDIDDPDNNEEAQAVCLRTLDAFRDTYTERSPSGRGWHIWVRGRVEESRRRKPLEMYSRERYFTMTGEAYYDEPIIHKDYELVHLWHELGWTKAAITVLGEGRPEQYDDTAIYEMGCKAEGEKNPGQHFADLFHGRWQQWHPSASEADLALVNMISFYSRNADQIKRVFLASNLGQRPKAHRKGYLDEMVKKSFDNLPVDVNVDALLDNLEHKLSAEREKVKQEPPKSMLGPDYHLPPGLMGQIAEYIYDSAPRPVREIALAAAIGLMGGIAGRAYNISNTGLNQYVLLLAETGVGKEALKGGVSRLIKAVADPSNPTGVPVAHEFIGPGQIASGQALIKYLSHNACFVSIIGEFGLTLQHMCSPIANSSQVMLKQMILDLYNKSGINDTLQPTIYSDRDKSTSVVEAPSLSILGETTPDSYFPHLDEHMVAQGLIPRFITIQYTGKRVSANKKHASVKPSKELLDGLSILLTNSLTMQQHKKAIQVKTDADAEQEFDAFDTYCDQRHREAESDVERHLWSRSHVKLLKLAALVAVGVHAYEPVVTREHVLWAKGIILADTLNIISRFSEGKIGNDATEQQQANDLISIIKDYLLRPYDAAMKNYRVDERLHKDRLIPWGYIQMRTGSKVSFKKDRIGATAALKRAVENLVNDGALSKMNALTIHQRYELTVTAYAVVNVRRFLDSH